MGGGGGGSVTDLPQQVKDIADHIVPFVNGDIDNLRQAGSLSAIVAAFTLSEPTYGQGDGWYGQVKDTTRAYSSLETLYMQNPTTMFTSALSGYTAATFDPPYTDFLARVKAQWDKWVTDGGDTTRIDTATQAHRDILYEHLSDRVIPDFVFRMRDVGAVLSSSFILGAAKIMADHEKDIAKFDADLRQAEHSRNLDRIAAVAKDGIALTGMALEADKMKSDLALQRAIFGFQHREVVAKMAAALASDTYKAKTFRDNLKTELGERILFTPIRTLQHAETFISAMLGGGLPRREDYPKPSIGGTIGSIFSGLGGVAKGVASLKDAFAPAASGG